MHEASASLGSKSLSSFFLTDGFTDAYRSKVDFDLSKW